MGNLGADHIVRIPLPPTPPPPVTKEMQNKGVTTFLRKRMNCETQEVFKTYKTQEGASL